MNSDDVDRLYITEAATIRSSTRVHLLLLTVEEGADVLAMSRASLYRLIRRGEIPVVKIVVMTRLEVSDLKSYLA